MTGSASSIKPFTTVPEDDTRLLDSLGVGTIHHPHHDRAFTDAMRSIRWAFRDGMLTVVLGPSRVGKSRLRREIVCALAERYPARAAAIQVTAAPETGSTGFSPNGLFSSILIALGDRAPDRHTITTTRLPDGLYPLGHTKTGNAKVFAVVQYLRRTEPSAVIVDEAGYLASGTDREREAIMRDLTWIAEISKVPFVLLGTYDGLQLLNVREDVNARIRFFHLSRYLDTVHGRLGFRSGLVEFDEHLIRLEQLDEDGFRLQHEPRFLYDATRGRFGLVFTLVDLACDIAREVDRHLRLGDLKEAQRHLMGDALGFGAKTREQERLAIRIVRAAVTDDHAGAAAETQRTSTTVAMTTRSRPTRVGERTVVRDPAFTAVSLRHRSA